MLLKSVLFTLLLLLIKASFSQEFIAENDSLKWYQRKVPNLLIAPTALTAVGLYVHKDRGFYSSYDAHKEIQNNYPEFKSKFDDQLRYGPAIATYGLNFAGVRGKSNFVKGSFIYAASTVICINTYRAIKRESNMIRPDSSDYRSMPSGHTAIAFVSATFMHEEFKHKSPWYSIAAYSMAAATGAYRMLNNKHWMSDVFIGAGIGILSTKLTYMAYPWIENNLCKCQKSNKTLIYPEANNQYFGLRIRQIL